MSDAHAGIVWNPTKTTREALETALAEQFDGRVSWFETTEDDPGQAATQQALDEGVDVVFAAGGDGTVRAVAEGLAVRESEVELGIIPLGTGNLLARNLGLPLNDPAAAFARAFEGNARPIDLGWVETSLPEGTHRHAFTVMAGFGMDAHMITETDESLKDKAGWLAYVESLGRAVAASEVIDLRLAFDGGATEEQKAHTLIVGNCGSLQAGVTLLPNADPGDGELDVLILHSDGLAGWMETLRTMMWDNGLRRLLRTDDEDQRAQSTDSTTHRRITSLTIELDEPRVFEVDGDDLGLTTRIDISVQPGAVRIR